MFHFNVEKEDIQQNEFEDTCKVIKWFVKARKNDKHHLTFT